MEQVRAILIDPHAKTTLDVFFPGSLEDDTNEQRQAMKVLLHCDWFQPVDLGNNQTLWLDEEGFINKPWDQQAFFKLDGGDHPFAGFALMVGEDGEGNIVSTSIRDAHAVLPFIEWVPREIVVVPKPTITGLDDDMNPIGAPEIISDDGDGETTWSYVNQPR